MHRRVYALAHVRENAHVHLELLLTYASINSQRNKKDKMGPAYWLSAVAHTAHLLACEKLIQMDPKVSAVTIVKVGALCQLIEFAQFITYNHYLH